MLRWFLTEGDSIVVPTSAMNCERSRGGNPTDIELQFPFLGAKTFPATDYPHPGYNMPSCFPVRNVPMGEPVTAFNFFALDLLNDSFSNATKISIMTNQSHPPALPLYVACEGIVGVDVLRPRITWNTFPYSYYTNEYFVYQYEFHEVDITEAEILALMGNEGLHENFKFYAGETPLEYQFWFMARFFPNKMFSAWGYYWDGWNRTTFPMEVGYRIRMYNGPQAVFQSYFEVTKVFLPMEFVQVGLTNNNVLDFLGAGQRARFWFLNFPAGSPEETPELVYWFTRDFSVVARMKIPERTDFVFLLNFSRGLVDASDNRYEVVPYDADGSYNGPNDPPVVANGECSINGGSFTIRDVARVPEDSPFCFDFKFRTDMSFQDFKDWVDARDFKRCTLVDTENFSVVLTPYGSYLDIEGSSGSLLVRVLGSMVFDGNWHHIAVVRNELDEVAGFTISEIFFDGRNSHREAVTGYALTYWQEYGSGWFGGADWNIGDNCPFVLDEVRLSLANPFVSDFIPYSVDYSYSGMPDLEFIEIVLTTTTEAPDLDGSTMLYHCQDQISAENGTNNSYAADFTEDTALYSDTRYGNQPYLTYLGKFDAAIWFNGGLIEGAAPNIDCNNDVMVEFWMKFPAQSFGVAEEYKSYNLFKIGKFEGRIDVSPTGWWYNDENNDPLPGFCASLVVPAQDNGEDGVICTYLDIPEEELFDGNYHHFVFFYDAMRDVFHVRLDGGLGHTIYGYGQPSPQNILSIEDKIVAVSGDDSIRFGEWQSDQPTIEARIDEIRIMWGIECPFNNGEDGNNWFEVPTEPYYGPNEAPATTTSTTTEDPNATTTSTTTEEEPPA